MYNIYALYICIYFFLLRGKAQFASAVEIKHTDDGISVGGKQGHKNYYYYFLWIFNMLQG